MANGGKILIDCLLALGAKRGFGIPGESYLAILDALFDKRKILSLFCVETRVAHHLWPQRMVNSCTSQVCVL